MLQLLENALTQVLDEDRSSTFQPPAFFSRLLQDLQEVGWEHVGELHPDLNQVTLEIPDCAGRAHEIIVKIPPNFPSQAPTCRHELPVPSSFIPRWSPASSSLHTLYQQFADLLEQFQGFWAVMDDLDANCVVLEPARPRRNDRRRRIMLQRYCSLVVEIDPASPTAIPHCRFLGSESLVSTYRDRLNLGIRAWDASVSVVENLGNVLQMDWKTLREGEGRNCGGGGGGSGVDGDEAGDLECGICYNYRIDGDRVPDFVCENQLCSKQYHRSCLVEWLKTLPGTRQNFNTYFWECPYCSQALSVNLGDGGT